MERPPRSRSLLVALFVTAVWGACSFAVAGILAVLLDRDPVQTPVAPVAGVAGVGLAAVAVWLAVGLTARARTPWVGVLAAVAAVYLVIVGAAFLVSFRLFAEQASSPFVIVAALLAGVAVAVTHAALRYPPNGSPHNGGPPNAGLSGPSPHS